MQVILYNAISLDGFIATSEGDSEWVSDADSEAFEQFCKSKGCIFVGRATYEQYPEIYPMDGVVTIVLSSKFTSASEGVSIAGSVDEALEMARRQGFTTGVLVGGAKTNSAFLGAGVIAEMYLSVHPLFLGKGIKVFEHFPARLNLGFLEEKKIGQGVIQVHYELSK